MIYYMNRGGNMFDNNNQNYNNGNPLFNNTNNNFNNGVVNANAQNQYNNYNLQGMGQNVLDSSAFMSNSNFLPNQAPIQNIPTESNNFLNGYNSTLSSNDIPPDLGEIKNLSEATVSTAPTMDVLDPMNVMPNNLPTNNDPLDAYENGSININSSLNNSVIPQNVQTQNNISDNLNMFQNIPETNPVNNLYNSQMIQPSNYEGIPQQNNIIQSNPNINIQNSNLVPNQYNNINQNASLNFNNDYNASLANNFNSQPISPSSQLNSLNIQSTSESINNNIPTQSDNIIDNHDFELTKPILEEKNEEKDSDDTNEEKDYNIIQNQDLADNKGSNPNVTDLGLDESYTEQDTLEIMDIENDELDDDDGENAVSIVESHDIEPGSISKSVEKIKELIEEIKTSGISIELEEFDFESMYQLVIKIKK